MKSSQAQQNLLMESDNGGKAPTAFLIIAATYFTVNTKQV